MKFMTYTLANAAENRRRLLERGSRDRQVRRRPRKG
jgi:hypothetical protein